MTQIPVTVQHQELISALAPLLELCGVTAEEVYSDPPLMVGRSITFTAALSVRDRAAAAGLPIQEIVVGESEYEERAVTVSIPVDLFATEVGK